jgi:hypothetical protein
LRHGGNTGITADRRYCMVTAEKGVGGACIRCLDKKNDYQRWETTTDVWYFSGLLREPLKTYFRGKMLGKKTVFCNSFLDQG